MGAGKDMWIAEYEKILEDFCDDKYTEEEAVKALIGMGFDRNEAENEVQGCKA